MKKILIGIICLIIISLLVFVFINFSNKKEDKKVFNLDCSNSNCKKEVKGATEESNSNSNTQVNSNSNIESNSNSNITSNSNINSNITSNSNVTSNVTSNVSSNVNVRSNGNGTITSNVVVSNSNSNTHESSNVPSTVEDEDGKLTISDTVEVWSQQDELKIFDVDKIKPGDSGIYEFEIKNNTKKPAKYKLIFDEINIYHVNVMYKLKRNNTYIAGDDETWVKYDNLNFGEQILKKGKKDAYTLEWKWVDSENDTEVGITKGAKYTLKVSIQGYKTQDIDKKVKGTSENPMTLDNIKFYIGLLIVSIISIIILAKSYRKNNIWKY